MYSSCSLGISPQWRSASVNRSLEISTPSTQAPRTANSRDKRPKPHGASSTRDPRSSLSRLQRPSASCSERVGGVNSDHKRTYSASKKLFHHSMAASPSARYAPAGPLYRVKQH